MNLMKNDKKDINEVNIFMNFTGLVANDRFKTTANL